jgi:radical SAM superfamily enzyme YgiQ (UPF0313 family)
MIPYPGTPLYDYCKKNNLLLTDDYDRFDQREPVMKTQVSAEDQKNDWKIIPIIHHAEIFGKKNIASPKLARCETYFSCRQKSSWPPRRFFLIKKPF